MKTKTGNRRVKGLAQQTSHSSYPGSSTGTGTRSLDRCSLFSGWCGTPKRLSDSNDPHSAVLYTTEGGSCQEWHLDVAGPRRQSYAEQTCLRVCFPQTLLLLHMKRDRDRDGVQQGLQEGREGGLAFPASAPSD